MLAVELWVGLARLRLRSVTRLAGVAAILPVPLVGVALVATLLAFAPLSSEHGHGHVARAWASITSDPARAFVA